MYILKLIIQVIIAILAGLAALSSILLFLRLSWPSPVLFILKLSTSALSPVLMVVGILTAIVGLASDSAFMRIMGIYVFLVFFIHIVRVTRAPDSFSNFEKAFGKDWEKQIKPAQKKHFLSRRTILTLPSIPKQRMEQNIVFAIIPGTNRELLCDLWQPAKNTTPSGLAFIYLHGSAWYFLDKDLGTWQFFNRLAAQGHVVMDVAYRLSPETDMMGMVNDVKRAIVWMKENGTKYGVNPEKIVLGGGSAGGHLALLTAYTAKNPKFTPKELEGKNLSVRAVISEYGPTDLEACYYHTNQHLSTQSQNGKPKKEVPSEMPAWMKKSMSAKDFHRLGFDRDLENMGALAPLLGGHPDERPQTYALYSPVTHVYPGCPPTLIIHGEHDVIAPIKTTRFMYSRLVEAKVPAVMHILPQTDHAFDLIMPKISPSSHNSVYDVERFLALLL